ncbi:MAG: cupredoxin domain-containing protein [Candidatus Berkelbacteria bacterium]|nr:cupredoxin domain-containing protein [Candidatus Berkelbacteria bacterium]
MKKSFILLSFVTICFIFSGCMNLEIKSVRDEATPTVSSSIQFEQTNLILIKDGQFSPDQIQVNVGEAVIFQNNDETTHQIASDPHPDHSDLPDLYSSEIYNDATYRYIFQKKGSFWFHLEDNPSVRGEVVVE